MSNELPFLTADLPGIGGRIKSSPEHFSVEEIPLYPPLGEGDHLYMGIVREGWTTRAVQQKLARLFDVKDADVGYAGMKDRQARVAQTFSLCLPGVDPEDALERARAHLPFDAAFAVRHATKLRTGQLAGNRFGILVVDAVPDALDRARRIAEAAAPSGLPNYFGEQRFGMRGDNARAGRAALEGRGPRDRWKRRLFLNAFQSELFNVWLAERIRRGAFREIFAGDVAKTSDTGGLFLVGDPKAEEARFAAGEIAVTGPVYGSRMWWAEGEPGVLEREILAEADVTEQMFEGARLEGTRRPAQVLMGDLAIEPRPEGLHFSFVLGKGSYATSLLREFMKSGVALSS